MFNIFFKFYLIIIFRGKNTMFRLVTIIFLFHLILGEENNVYKKIQEEILNLYNNAVSTIGGLIRKPVPADVNFYLYTNDISDVQLNESNLDLLNDKKIVFLIHGWISNKENSWYENVKNAFLEAYKEYSVVEVDWRKPATQFYDMSARNTEDVAKFITNFTETLNTQQNVKLDNILLIGHSLGAQIAGLVGKLIFKQTGQQLPRIIALDPAAPLFVHKADDERLNKNDAKVVEVIHSDGGIFGFEDAVGTIDFFPNGGKSQPGCYKPTNLKNIINFISCDHSRAGEYFAEAILNPEDFQAKKCPNWDSYEKGNCENEVVTLGNLETTATGNFYLETNEEKPFGKQEPEEKGILGNIKDIFGRFFNNLIS